MSLKLAVAVVLVALAGHGLAWPAANEETSKLEGSAAITASISWKVPPVPKLAFLLSFRDLNLPVPKFLSVGAQLLGHLSQQLGLTLHHYLANFKLLYKVMLCFLEDNISQVWSCGVWAYNDLKDDVHKMYENIEIYKEEVKSNGTEKNSPEKVH